jgi:hypothetical protein
VVARRADPERIYLARRAALFSKLTQTKAIDEREGERLIVAWERSPEAALADRFTTEYWEAAELWIASVRIAGDR